ERLNVLWRNIAAPNVALWTHLIRRRARIAPGAGTPGAMRQQDLFFAGDLHEKYHRRLANHTLMVNEMGPVR
ncbi:MAG TPA: hypothetical protein VNZ02_16155, partial [Steroidobacteraceae bacterium]|nr:hypothetical protein [Steroidobacteraceae bacterium]